MRKLLLVSLAPVLAAACGDGAENSKGGGGNANAGAPSAGQGGTGAGGAGQTGGAAGMTAGGAAGTSAGTGGAAAGSAGIGGAAGAGAGGSAGAMTDYYVGANGNDQNAGTQAAPFKTLTRAQQASIGGTTIWVLPGTIQYATTMVLNKSGTKDKPIRILAAAGARPILDFAQQPRGNTNSRGIDIRGDYWQIKGIEIANAADNGILISGSYNVIENVTIHHNDDTGLQIMASEGQATDNTRAVGNLILNCDSYENYDAATQGENADGFAAKLRIGTGNVFRGCRAWNNADDGWDMFAADDVVLVEDCWAFLNGTTARGSSPSSDGNGFKLGGEPQQGSQGQGHAPHIVTRGSAFDNDSCGFTLNNNETSPVLTQCGIGANRRDYCDVSCASDFTVQLTAAAAKAVKRNADGSLPPIR